MRSILSAYVLLVLLLPEVAFAGDLAVLKARPGQVAPSEMMAVYLGGLAFEALDQREAAFEEFKSPEQIAAYQERMRSFFIRQLGGYPERTPLNAGVVETLDRDGHRIEKVIFESRPGFHVTGLMFLPPGNGPFPAVLMPCGHSRNGKASDLYQRAAILLAINGIAAFLYDPIGQGERYQILNDEGKPIFGSTSEHTAVGVGSILLGLNTASYRVWDGIRAIDYLCSRPDVDASRIGCSGNSGGGTLTSYLMALDERIVAAAPSCYLTGFRRLLETIQAQDAEQNIAGQIAGGMDHSDYVLMRAPRPTLILCATQDYFDIGGTWSLYREAKRFYGRLGFPERVALVEAEAGHGFSRLLREGMVRWMRRWLLDIDDAVTEPDLQVLSDEEARCTPAGQVLLLPGARSVLDLNAELDGQLAPRRRRLWDHTPREECLEKVRELAGIRRLADLPEPSVQNAGAVERAGYRIEKLILELEEGIKLPALMFVPPQAGGSTYLYLAGAGKAQDAGEHGPIEKLVTQGHLVLAVDLRGIGETAGDGSSRHMTQQFGPNWRDFFLAYMLDKSFVGMRAEDVLVSARFLATRQSEERPEPLHLVATGECVIPALHALALEPDLFASASLEDVPTWSQSLRSWPSNQLIHAIHGALRVYDLDNLRSGTTADLLSAARRNNEQ